MKRMDVRVNDTVYSFVKARADRLHGGNVGDYVKSLIMYDMQTTDSDHRLTELKVVSAKLDTQIMELQTTLRASAHMKKEVDKKLKKEEMAIQPPQ